MTGSGTVQGTQQVPIFPVEEMPFVPTDGCPPKNPLSPNTSLKPGECWLLRGKSQVSVLEGRILGTGGG